MARLSVLSISSAESNPFDRQERIAWWDSQKVQSARIMVAGAGATGNETLKNLALLGARRLLIADFDSISLSNLSRTVLFRTADLGKRKARVAARRVKELCLAPSPEIDCFDGDIVWELGTGVYREMDLVFGCLDNVEARFAINHQCWLAGTPWIDAGILELGAHIGVYIPPAGPCYQCGASRAALAAARQRYSCDDFRRSIMIEGKLATIQVASALVSALQVQEGMKLLCGQTVVGGRYTHYDGNRMSLDSYGGTANPDCFGCTTYPEIHTIEASAEMTLRDFLALVSAERLSGAGAALDLRGDRNFVDSVRCPGCGRRRRIRQAAFRLYDRDVFCRSCAKGGADRAPLEAMPAEKSLLSTFSLASTDTALLTLTLRRIGVPWYHVVPVLSASGDYRYYLLGADRSRVFTSIDHEPAYREPDVEEETSCRISK